MKVRVSIRLFGNISELLGRPSSSERDQRPVERGERIRPDQGEDSFSSLRNGSGQCQILLRRAPHSLPIPSPRHLTPH